jgi:hypothetical protein
VNALDQQNAVLENTPPTVWWANLVALEQNSAEHWFGLRRAGCCDHFRGCEKAAAVKLWGCGDGRKAVLDLAPFYSPQ